jgi:hypothetical protein
MIVAPNRAQGKQRIQPQSQQAQSHVILNWPPKRSIFPPEFHCQERPFPVICLEIPQAAERLRNLLQPKGLRKPPAAPKEP